MKLAEYLGESISGFLEVEPFKNWKLERFVEDDLADLEFSYAFLGKPIEVICDRNELISTIFLFAESSDGFNFSEFPFSSTRVQLRQRLGEPSKSGEKSVSPVLGPSGAWDRFAQEDFTIHIEYRTDSNAVCKVTLMRNDVVPK